LKRLLALVAGGLGLGALLSRRRRRPLSTAEPSPADELRERLAESRAAEVEHAPDPAPAGEPEPGVADRRREVHERARGAIDELS